MFFFKNNASLEIIKGFLSEYDIQSTEDMEEVLQDLLGGIIKCALCTKALCQTNSHKKKSDILFLKSYQIMI